MCGSGRAAVHVLGCSPATELYESIRENDPFLSPLQYRHTVMPLVALLGLFLDGRSCHRRLLLLQGVRRCPVTLFDCAYESFVGFAQGVFPQQFMGYVLNITMHYNRPTLICWKRLHYDLLPQSYSIGETFADLECVFSNYTFFLLSL